jgi:D-serine deaminase-like pyridoxal phosphate-dependent protein
MQKQNIPYPLLNTPTVLINLNKLETNIGEMQKAANEAGVKLRLHTKVHQSVAIAKMQLEAGACGIEVGVIDQAEPMAEEGIDDILIAHPFYGDHKLQMLKKLLIRPSLKLSCVVDMVEQAEGISHVARDVGRIVPVLIKLDIGVGRYGVRAGQPALNLAKRLSQLPGVEFLGLYARGAGAEPTDEGIARAAFEELSEACDMARVLRKQGFKIEHVSVGASPTYYATCQYLKEGRFPEITELHPGHRVIGDILYMMARGNTKESCAASVLVSVMSTSHPEHVVIDAGWKTFGAESMIEWQRVPGFFWNGRPSYGSIQGRQDLWFGRISAESGLIYYREDAKRDLKPGDRLEIVPNSVSLVVNIHEQLYGVRNGKVEMIIPVTGRCRGS